MNIVFVGDLALGDHPKTIGFGFESKYGDKIPVSKASRIVPKEISPSIVFGNLEYPLYPVDKDSTLPSTVNDTCCRGWPEYAQFLRTAGIGVLNVANNHIYQHGDDAFVTTLRALDNAEIKTCGTPKDFSGEQVFNVDGTTIAFLGWSDRPRQYLKNAPPYNELDVEFCCDAVSAMTRTVDVVCVSIHWGNEFINIPEQRERDIARKLIDAGASVIVGHHPHVLREVESYNGGVIAYSLGNNVCDMSWNSRTRETASLVVSVENKQVADWDFYPGAIGDDFFPDYYTGKKREKVKEQLDARYEQLTQSEKSISYRDLAERALRRHQVLTLWFFVRNIFRYEKSILLDAIKHAVGIRIYGILKAIGLVGGNRNG